GRPELLEGPVDDLDRTYHPRAEPSRLGQKNPHSHQLLALWQGGDFNWLRKGPRPRARPVLAGGQPPEPRSILRDAVLRTAPQDEVCGSPNSVSALRALPQDYDA